MCYSNRVVRFAMNPILFSIVLIGVQISLFGQNKLQDPELLKPLFPEKLGESLKESGFSTRTSESMNWAGTSYINDEGSIVQVGIWLYTEKGYRKNKRKETKDREVIESDPGKIFYKKYMGQHDLKLFLNNDVAVRVTASPDVKKKDAVAFYQEIPLDKIRKLEVAKN